MSNGNEGTCVPETESPVLREIRMISERLTELEKTSQVIANRLSNILSNAKPEEQPDKQKVTFQSALEEQLSCISGKIDSNISFLKNIISRLTI